MRDEPRAGQPGCFSGHGASPAPALAIDDYDALGAREAIRAIFVLRARLGRVLPTALHDELRRIEVHEVLHRRRRQVLEALRRARSLPTP